MVVRFSPKILGLNVGMFGLFSGNPRLCLEIGFDPRTDVFGFFCVFGVWGYFWKNSGSEKWTELGLVQGVLRMDDALLN